MIGREGGDEQQIHAELREPHTCQQRSRNALLIHHHTELVSGDEIVTTVLW